MNWFKEILIGIAVIAVILLCFFIGYLECQEKKARIDYLNRSTSSEAAIVLGFNNKGRR